MTELLTCPVVPVLTVTDPELAVPLVRALAAGGMTDVEITLRSPAALEAVVHVRAELPEVVCGIGTLRRPADVEAALAAGAQFLVAPGSTEPLLDALAGSGVLALPGVATPSEAMRAADRGFGLLKLFPAEAVGGLAALAALAGPLPELRFCATGGITLASAAAYLGLPNVRCVGGSWLAPRDVVARQDWVRVTELARETLGTLTRV